MIAKAYKLLIGPLIVRAIIRRDGWLEEALSKRFPPNFVQEFMDTARFLLDCELVPIVSQPRPSEPAKQDPLDDWLPFPYFKEENGIPEATQPLEDERLS